MASNELKAFLRSTDESYEQYADQLHDASFTMVKELAAASPELLELRAKVPIGAAGAIVKAAGVEPQADLLIKQTTEAAAKAFEETFTSQKHQQQQAAAAGVEPQADLLIKQTTEAAVKAFEETFTSQKHQQQQAAAAAAPGPREPDFNQVAADLVVIRDFLEPYKRAMEAKQTWHSRLFHGIGQDGAKKAQ